MSEAPFLRFDSLQDLLNSFAIYSMASSAMDKETALIYAKTMYSYNPTIGYYIASYGFVPREVIQ